MAMQLTFEVGTTEKHVVAFSFDRFWGGLTITVDGNSVVDQVRLFSVNLVATWQFTVGTTEIHHVQIDKHRAVFFAGFRPQPVFAYVDGVGVAQGVA
jgi:hypothetical protein